MHKTLNPCHRIHDLLYHFFYLQVMLKEMNPVKQDSVQVIQNMLLAEQFLQVEHMLLCNFSSLV